MESIAALSLACNVLQVIDLGFKAIEICDQIREHGSSQQNQTLAIQSKYLQDAASEVTKGLAQASPTTASLSQHDLGLRELANQCTKTAQRLQDLLKKVEKKSGASKLSSLRATARTLWKKNTIDEVRKELSDYQNILQTEILVHMKLVNPTMVKILSLTRTRFDQARSSQEDTNRFKDLVNKFAALDVKLTESQFQTADLLQNEQNTTRLLVQDEGRRVREHIDQKHDWSKWDDATEKAHQRLLRSLKYPAMHERWNMVKEAHENTYEWIFDEEAEHPWSPFVPFLKSDQPLYWIRGKPGSGKSCLMKMISTDPRTRTALEESHRGTNITLIQFFFWLPGSPLQRSSKGLWSSLTSQLLEQNQPAISKLLLESLTLNNKDNIGDWSLEELFRVFVRALELIPGLTCIFLDGLDEYDFDESPIEIRKHVKSLISLPDVKLCVSSRPEPRFEQWLCSFPHLRLEQLTEKDIRNYAGDILREASMGGSFGEISNDQLSDLQHMIVDKADGVFLWAYYSLNSLVHGFLGGDNWSELTERLEHLPSEILDLYRHTWNRLNKDTAIYHSEAAVYFKLVSDWDQNLGLYRYGRLTLVEASIAGNMTALKSRVLTQGDDIPLAEFAEQCRKAEFRLLYRCAGLLEVCERTWKLPTGGRYNDEAIQKLQPYFSKEVHFIHRSVPEFLSGTDDGRKIMVECHDNAIKRSKFYFFLILIRYLLVESASGYTRRIKFFRSTLGTVLLELPDDQCLSIFHLFVRSIQRRLDRDGLKCPQDGWNFPYPRHSSSPAVDFIGKAAQCGYKEFVQSFLENAGGDRNLSSKYLNYLLSCAAFGLGESASYALNCQLRALADSSALVQELLNRGADPSYRYYLAGIVPDPFISSPDKDIYFLTITPFQIFLLSSQHLTDIDATHEARKFWQANLQSFRNTGADLALSNSVMLNAGLSTISTRYFDFVLPVHDALVMAVTVADLLRISEAGIRQEIPVLETRFPRVPTVPPVPTLRTRVLYLQKVSRTHEYAPKYFKIVSDQHSEVLLTSLNEYRQDLLNYDKYDNLKNKFDQVVQQSIPLERTEFLGELVAKGWAVEKKSRPSIGEPFEDEHIDENVST